MTSPSHDKDQAASFSSYTAAITVLFSAIALGIVAWLPLCLLQAQVLADLWLWFVVPTFGAKPLSLGLCYGLGLFIHFGTRRHYFMLLPTRQPEIDPATFSRKDFAFRYAALIFYIVSTWGAGYLVAHFWAHTL